MTSFWWVRAATGVRGSRVPLVRPVAAAVKVATINAAPAQIARNGEFVTLVGPSGCGKSTLLGILGGLLQPTSGRILTDGAPPAGTLHAHGGFAAGRHKTRAGRAGR